MNIAEGVGCKNGRLSLQASLYNQDNLRLYRPTAFDKIIQLLIFIIIVHTIVNTDTYILRFFPLYCNFPCLLYCVGE